MAGASLSMRVTDRAAGVHPMHLYSYDRCAGQRAARVQTPYRGTRLKQMRVTNAI